MCAKKWYKIFDSKCRDKEIIKNVAFLISYMECGEELKNQLGNDYERYIEMAIKTNIMNEDRKILVSTDDSSLMLEIILMSLCMDGRIVRENNNTEAHA